MAINPATYTTRPGSIAHRVLAAVNTYPDNPWSVSDIATAMNWPTDSPTGPIRVALDTLKRHGLMCYRPATWVRPV